MKISSKPILSPSRTENFPQPLMLRFLKSNVGSKSRGRSSRSSPLFVRKKNASVIETQEPSSPKVTCIGQVRVRRSSGSNSGNSRTFSAKCPCFCNPRKPKIRSFCSVLSKWVSFLRFGCCRKDNIKEDAPNVVSNRRDHCQGIEREHKYYKEKEEEEEEGNNEELVQDVYASSTPPKNALLLTRSRSAPYRSSSLACRILGSPNGIQETEENENGAQKRCDFEAAEIKFNGPENLLGKSRNLVRGNQESVDSLGTHTHFEGLRNIEATPVTLTRCKSEPSRTGERLIPSDNQHHFLLESK